MYPILVDEVFMCLVLIEWKKGVCVHIVKDGEKRMKRRKNETS